MWFATISIKFFSSNRLSLEQAEKVVKTLGIVFATMFAAKTVSTIMDIVTVIRSLTTALKGTVIVQTALTALSGPRGIALIGAAALAAAGAVYALNKALEGTNDEMKEATGGTPGAPAPAPASKPAFAKASQYSKEELQARKQALTTAQQTTQQQIAQNKAAQDYQRIINNTIGMQQDQADIIKLNAQLEQDANSKILDLTKQIDIEKSKGRGTNQGVIAELEKQKQEVLQNLIVTKELKSEENDRLNILKAQASFAKLASQENNYILENKLLEEKIKLIGLVGDEAAKENIIRSLTEEFNRKETEYYNKKISLASNATDMVKQEIEDEWNTYKAYFERRTTLEAEYYKKQKAVREDSVIGAKSAIEAITRSMDPYQVALASVNSVWSNMGTAIDKFVDGSTMKFSDLAKSIIRDLIKIQLKAQATKLFSAAGSFFTSLLGFAEGGTPPLNKPSIVGENGPELFVPKSAGTIIPNNKVAAMGSSSGSAVANAAQGNTYITNNISAIDAKSVAQLFAENRKTLFGSVQMAQKELSYGR